jgi:hypothetical protein
LHHDHCSKVRGLGVEYALSRIGHRVLTDIAVGIQDIHWEDKLRGVVAISSTFAIYSSEVNFVVDQRKPIRERIAIVLTITWER